MKVFFVSDVHLGSGVNKAENDAIEKRFLEWLSFAHLQRAKIFLLGDIFDFWFEYAHVIPTAHSAVLGRLKEMVSDGIEIHFFKGNHDMWLRTYLQKEIGLIIHSRSEILEIEGEKLLIGHGHDLCFRRTILTRLLWILFNTQFFYDFFSAILHPNVMMRIGKLWSSSSRSKKSISHEFQGDNEYITRYVNDHLEFYSTLGVKKYIFGHFHCPTLYKLKDGVSQLMILGEWSDQPMYGALENGKLELFSTDQNAD